ncbi:hypothetical protein [Deinococcus cellulosilyticus]|uniref:Uncharacterized protein n=1 Tax=Deinococcus cellulosilyticus (strain DSM 18568 / NBRC 106333 / KACC 11606 / 5516J-15) TaxID=1223518 RepID=A0A511N7C3_DEIC1|nr:hypothetical protein [Deinococcus cellulosilyticus]GEM48730.1 hypothetical protein DC3_43650 [Deinococcus cellulosilyticus NBRC 106333 = KACC 11606]
MTNEDRMYGGMMGGGTQDSAQEGGQEEATTMISIVAPAFHYTKVKSVAREQKTEMQKLITDWVKDLIRTVRRGEDLKSVPNPSGNRKSVRIPVGVDDALEKLAIDQELKLGTRVTKSALVYEAIVRGLKAAGEL